MIATLATRAAEAGSDVIVVTGDRDAYQLVEDPHIKVLYNRRGVSDYVLYDEAGIVERTGVTAGQYPEYAALRGDPSDNLPGVPGVGEKTAAKLVSTYGDLEGIFAHLDDLPPKQRQNLGDARDRVFLNRQMSMLVRDVPLDVDPGELRQGPWDREEVKLLFDQLAFRTLMPRLLEGLGETSAAVAAQADTLDIEVEVMRDARRGARALRRALDEQRVLRARAALGRRTGREPAARRSGSRTAIAPRTSTPNCCATRRCGMRSSRCLSAGGPPLVAHRAKELMHGLDVDARALQHDTAVMAYLLDPAPGKYALDDLALRYLSLEVRSADAEPGTLDLDGDIETEQTGRRAAVVLRLATALASAIEARELTDLYERFELPLVRVLAKMEAAGIRIDREFLDTLSADLSKQCEVLVHRIYAHAGEEFNVNSTPAAPHDSLREARPRPGEEDEDRPVHRRRLAPEDGRRAPDRRRPAALSRGGEAAKHLRRRAPAVDQLRRSYPRDVQTDRYHHRPHLERGAEPPERPRPHRPTVARSAARSSPTWDRVSSPPTIRRSSSACSRTWRTTPASSTRSSAAPTCTPPLPPRCSTCPKRR